MMTAHYIKVALRTLLKYKVQSFCSMFGIAIAFTCVALAVFWSHYEETYDSFHRNSGRIYQCQIENVFSERIVINQSGHPLRIPPYMEETYPEVEKACGIKLLPFNNGRILMVTSGALGMFDFEWIEGNSNVESWNEKQVGISEELARKLFGNSSPIGKKIDESYNNTGELEIVAVYETWTRHSNYRFDLLGHMKIGNKLSNIGDNDFYVMLNSHSDHERFIEKLQNDTIHGVTRGPFTVKSIIPLTSIHYVSPTRKANLQIEYVHLFSLAAILLSICALLNYMTLFVARLLTKGRDMALRTICGASGWQLSKLLMVEYILLLLGVFLISGVFIEGGMSLFMEYAMIDVDRFTVYAGCLFLLLFVIVLAILLSFFPILYFKRKTLRMQIEPASVANGTYTFRKASICVQLFASLLFIFCATLMFKQIHYLTHSDIGIERNNIAYMTINHSCDKYAAVEILRQQPSVKDVQFVSDKLYPCEVRTGFQVNSWEEKADDTPSFSTKRVPINDSIANFFGIEIKEGLTSFDALNDNEILVDEMFVKAMNVANPIGKSIQNFKTSLKIVGIVHHFQAQNPREPIVPILYSKALDPRFLTYIAIKYDGDFTSFSDIIIKTLEQRGIDVMSLSDAEETFKGYMENEYNYLKLLSMITVVILLIALFGVYALILQECERQRKNIAIRKVYGAQVKDILMMFFKEYMLQVAIAASVAFPIGYVLMKGWLEGYSRQTGVGIGVFLGIFVGMSVLVSLCIGWHVWKAANENPATAVKKE